MPKSKLPPKPKKNPFNQEPSNLAFISSRLSELENLQQINLQELTQGRGIYFLMQNITVVYVGQSVDVFQRVRTHVVEGAKTFNNVYFYPVPFGNLNVIEREFIKEFKPRYNIAGKPTTKEDMYRPALRAVPDEVTFHGQPPISEKKAIHVSLVL
jgi:hypothetical protein